MAFNPERIEKSAKQAKIQTQENTPKDTVNHSNPEVDFENFSLERDDEVEDNKKTNNTPKSDESNQDEKNKQKNLELVKPESLSLLEPKKDINVEAKSDPYRIMVTQKEAYQMTLKTLNALSVVTPIISSLLLNLEPTQDGKKLSEDFNKIINEVSVAAESTCEKIGVDSTKANNRWVRNMLERIYAQMANEQWIAKKEVKLDDVFYLIDKVIEHGENAPEKMMYIDLEENSSVALSCITAMSPIIDEMEQAPLFRNVENDIEPIMDKLFSACENALNKLSNDYADSENRAKLFHMLMIEAGKIYASSWRNEVKRINAFMSKNQNVEKIKIQIEEYKKNGGMPLVNIDKNFDKFFDRVVVITSKLIEDRRKKK